MFSKIMKWRNRFIKHSKEESKSESEVEIELHTRILRNYFLNLSTICDFRTPLPSTEPIAKQELKEMFMVPKLNNSHQAQNCRITKVHLLEAFLSLLLQLLHHKTHLIVGPFKDGIDILEKELRYLLTILGDISWMLCHRNDLQAAEFQNMLPQFEAVANRAGSFVHYLFSRADTRFAKMDKGLAAVLKHIKLLKANLQSSINPSAFTAPRTSLVDSILILGSLVDDLEDLLKRGDDPIADVKDQVNLIHKELRLSRSSLHGVISQQPSTIEELKDPLRRIGGIAHQAEYLITSFLVKDAPLWYVLKRLTDLSRKIEPINKELQLITQKYQFGGLRVAEKPFQHKRNTEGNNIFVGFEDKTTEILDQLVGGGTQSLQIISILGMPGLGKTTLANKLYNHPLTNYTFDKLSWCVVSQTYNRQSILANILIHINSELGKDNILNMEEIILLELIHKTLMGRRYLIVLDDIWDSSVSDELVRCFPDDGNGSRILVTSRNKDVAPPNSIMHELPFLSDDQCWELLEKKAFGSQTCPPELQAIGKKIAARCCGLPLTVVVIAGILSTLDLEENKWEEVGESLGSYIEGEDNSVMQILELSYKHLPYHLKPCFLYFGEFKEDEEISVENLKRLWVAEGFIRTGKDKNAENIAEEYLMKLIDKKSLVMVVKRRINGRGAKRCVVHDLLRDLCLKKGKEESFLKYRNNNCPNILYEKGHRIRAFGDTATLSYCQHVRSFVGDHQSSSFYVRDMRLLRVLHFKKGYDSISIIGIDHLVNLRYLVINNLPTWIDTLRNLEYIRVESFERVYLPPTIVKMKKLRYFRAESAEYGENWTIGNQTSNLECLSLVIIKELKDEELLKRSPYLRKLRCGYDKRRIMDKNAPHFDLSFLTQLDSLYLFGSLNKRGFGFPPNIRKLTLDGLLLPWEKMSIVGRLEFLEVLKITWDAFEGGRWDTQDGEFQKLRFLQLEGLHSLCEWSVASNEHFPILQQLIIYDCSNLQEIPSEIGEITTLELIHVKWGCLKSVAQSAERIKQEQRDMGNEDLRVIIGISF